MARSLGRQRKAQFRATDLPVKNGIETRMELQITQAGSLGDLGTSSLVWGGRGSRSETHPSVTDASSACHRPLSGLDLRGSWFFLDARALPLQHAAVRQDRG